MNVRREVVNDRLYGLGGAVRDKEATGLDTDCRRETLGDTRVLRRIRFDKALEECWVRQNIRIE